MKLSNGIPRKWFVNGFTLLELLAVVVVMGILTSLAAPSIAGLISRIKAERALDTLVGDLYYARMMAVRSGRRVEVRFDWNADASCVLGYKLVQISTPERTLKSISMADESRGVCLDPDNGGNTLTYNSRGLPSGLGTATITATSGPVTLQVKQSKAGRLYRLY